ncbi:hypothetical protein C2E16_19130 [Mixta calida]|uniref:Uncharacterized protein n=1 Tax=Mixta calida TaxID=665913 RepID=A0ABN5HDU6_9GAMM|nr:hypothetical protein C2E16_19130 [Mixta calida]ORM60179.1 hypothetical protein HA40_07810 [Mixta calida]
MQAAPETARLSGKHHFKAARRPARFSCHDLHIPAQTDRAFQNLSLTNDAELPAQHVRLFRLDIADSFARLSHQEQAMYFRAGFMHVLFAPFIHIPIIKRLKIRRLQPTRGECRFICARRIHYVK